MLCPAALQVGNELTKYGTVEDVMIFEVTTPGYQPEEAVRGSKQLRHCWLVGTSLLTGLTEV